MGPCGGQQLRGAESSCQIHRTPAGLRHWSCRRGSPVRGLTLRCRVLLERKPCSGTGVRSPTTILQSRCLSVVQDSNARGASQMPSNAWSDCYSLDLYCFYLMMLIYTVFQARHDSNTPCAVSTAEFDMVEQLDNNCSPACPTVSLAW